MKPFILFLLLMGFDAHANPNWIQLDDELISNDTKNTNDLKMYDSKPYSIGMNGQKEIKNKAPSDRYLMEVLKQIQTAVQKVKPKIKKQ